MLVRAAAALLAVVLATGCVSAPPRPADLTELTVTDAARLIALKKVTSVELTQAYLASAEANRDLNAFITLDRAGALAAAQRADTELATGVRPKGALHGVPLVVKDNTHVAGLPNTAGTPGLREFVPQEHAPTVTSLVNAGAVILGKTNMHELAFGISATTRHSSRRRRSARAIPTTARVSPAAAAAAPAPPSPRGWRPAGSAATPAARSAFPRA